MCVYVAGKDVGIQQVTEVMAWWYRKYANGQAKEDQDDYEHAESMAKFRR